MGKWCELALVPAFSRPYHPGHSKSSHIKIRDDGPHNRITREAGELLRAFARKLRKGEPLDRIVFNPDGAQRIQRPSTPSQPRGLQRGDVLKGKYEVLALIGKGGMSRVYLARDLELANKQWAIKEVDRHATDPLGRSIEQSLTSEADLLSRLQHPGIVGIADIQKTDDFIYVVMDHVEGESLDKVVGREGPQREEDVKAWMLQICSALSYLHRQDPPIIYRDMKPNNIMLHPDGYVKLIDLGVAREYKDGGRQDTIAFGTTGYAAPEQYGKAQTDGRSDIYGLGVTMWHLLAGSPPPVEFPLPNVREENPAVGEGFADVIIPRCTQLARTERYQSCEELAADLEAYQELTREHRTKQRRKVGAFAATLLAAVLLALTGCGSFAARDDLITQTYEHHLGVANALLQVEPQEAQVEYLAAIAEKPDALEAYQGLIRSYKVDSLFTPEEKQQLDAVYGQNLGTLKAAGCFAELSYEIGRLYWYFYGYGQTGTYEENQATRIKASSEHFANAAQDPAFQDADTARNYATIAGFLSGIDAAVMQGEETPELYGGFWESLCQLEAQMGSERMEMVKLDGCVLLANAVETYMAKFQSIGGVDQGAMEDLVSAVRMHLEDLDGTTEANRGLRDETLARLADEIAPKLMALFAAGGGEGAA